MNKRAWLPLLALLICFCACKHKDSGKGLVASLDLNGIPVESFMEVMATDKSHPLPQVKVRSDLGKNPEILCMGNDQPDLFEVDYQFLSKGIPYAAALDQLKLSASEDAQFGAIYFQPGNLSGHHYYIPFHLSWPAVFYVTSRFPEGITELSDLSDQCKDNPGSLGLAFGDDRSLVEFMTSVIWAFSGDPFDLNQEGTYKALYFLAGLSNCLSPYSANYDTTLLAEALAKDEVGMTFGDLDLAAKLADKGKYPFPITGAPFPGRAGLAFTGTYLAVHRNSLQPRKAYDLAIQLGGPSGCEKIIESGMWLCGLPFKSEVEPILENKDLFPPFLQSRSRLKPAPRAQDFHALAEIYRSLLKRIALSSERVDLVAPDLALSLKQLEP